MKNISKHFGNMISWGSFMINILVILLILNNKLSIKVTLFTVILAAFLDMFDGKIARMYITNSEDFIFGEVTDSLCDTLNFGIVPMFTFIYFFKENILICFFVTCFYLWAVVFRLARFSRDKKDAVITYYTGLPVTIAGPLSILFTILFENNLFVLSILLVIISYLMISDLKVKKLKI